MRTAHRIVMIGIEHRPPRRKSRRPEIALLSGRHQYASAPENDWFRGGVTMKPLLKWAGIVAASLTGLLVLATAWVFIDSQRILDRSYPKRPSAVHSPGTAEAVARGAHLTVVSTCTDCHGKNLTGTPLPVPGSTFYAPNLTMMTRSLSDADIDLAIRQGLRPDGKSVLFMPSHGYASFTDDEVASIIAYLRSLSPQGAASPAPHLGLGVRVALVAGMFRTEAAEFSRHAAARSAG